MMTPVLRAMIVFGEEHVLLVVQSLTAIPWHTGQRVFFTTSKGENFVCAVAEVKDVVRPDCVTRTFFLNGA